MTSQHVSSNPHIPPPWIDAPPSLEERLRVVRERCRLLADVFNIQAEASFLACHVSMSADAFHALTDMCRSSADDLERLVQDIPGSIANWCPGVTESRGLKGCPGVMGEGAIAYDASSLFDASVESSAWDRCKNPVDGDERP
jgi:hypothetical protein